MVREWTDTDECPYFGFSPFLLVVLIQRSLTLVGRLLRLWSRCLSLIGTASMFSSMIQKASKRIPLYYVSCKYIGAQLESPALTCIFRYEATHLRNRAGGSNEELGVLLFVTSFFFYVSVSGAAELIHSFLKCEHSSEDVNICSGTLQDRRKFSPVDLRYTSTVVVDNTLVLAIHGNLLSSTDLYATNIL